MPIAPLRTKDLFPWWKAALILAAMVTGSLLPWLMAQVLQ